MVTKHPADAAREPLRIINGRFAQGWATSAVQVCCITEKRRQHLRGVRERRGNKSAHKSAQVSQESAQKPSGTGWLRYASILTMARSAVVRTENEAVRGRTHQAAS